MIGAVGSYTGVQRYAQVNPAAIHGSPAAAEASSIVAAYKSSELGTPVQPVTTVKTVDPDGSGNLNVGFAVHSDPGAAEMSVRMRMSSPEDEAAELSPWAQLQEEIAARQERLEAEQKAKAKLEAYLERVKEQEAAREERVEALKEGQSGNETGDEEESAEEQPNGSLQLDHTSALLRNYQMNSLMQDMFSARVNGEDTSGYSAAIDAILQNGRERVRFVTGENEGSDARRRYQQTVNDNRSVFGAVA